MEGELGYSAPELQEEATAMPMRREPTTRPVATAKPRTMSSLFGSKGNAQGMTKKAAPTTKPKQGSLLLSKKPASSNAMSSQVVISMLKAIQTEMMGRFDKLEGLIAQQGVAAATSNLQDNSGMDMSGGRRRRATKRRGHKRR
jgi:hypothetical protein